MGNPEGSDKYCRSKVMVRCCEDEKWQHLQNSNSNFGNFHQTCGALQNVCYGKLVKVCCVVLLCFFGLQSPEIPKQFGMVVIKGLSWCILIILAASVLTCQDGWCQL